MCYERVIRFSTCYTAPDSSKWPNLLQLSELLFSLPFSNAHVERMFSTLKIIKTEWRTLLKCDTLSDLLEIQGEGPPLVNFYPDEAVKLWWEDCRTTRQVIKLLERSIDKDRIQP